MIHRLEPYELFAAFSQIEKTLESLKWDYSRFIEIADKIEESCVSIRIESSISSFREVAEIYADFIEMSQQIISPIKTLEEIRHLTAPYFPEKSIYNQILTIYSKDEKDS